jgi:hypothetical protein
MQRVPGRCVEEAAMPAVDRRVVWWTGLVVLFAALGVPLLAVQVPLLTGYRNHLARCYVLAFGESDPVLSRMFSTH